LSLHATGRTTGIVVECGAGVTQTAAVFDNFVIREACKRVDFGGNDVSAFLRSCLVKEHKAFFEENFSGSSKTGEWECINDIKHKLGIVSLSNSSAATTTTNYTLPDGTDFSINSKILHQQIGNTLFSGNDDGNNNETQSSFSLAYHNSPSCSAPSSSRSNSSSISEFVLRETLKKCDINLRSQLCENLYLAGGATLMKNFPERFAMEFANLIPASSRVRVHASNGRENAAWMGGNVICQLSSSVLNFGVTRSQYLEEGQGILLKRKRIG
jgi:actin-related protein